MSGACGLKLPDVSSGGSLAIVIPVHGSFEHVEMCLRSVVAARGSRDWIVVVDDGSPEGPRLHALVRDVVGDGGLLVRHTRRRGFSEAVNSGVTAASRLAVEAVLILNSDTAVLRDSIHLLERALLDDASVGAVGPLSNSAGRQSVPGDLRSLFDRLLLRAPANPVPPVVLERAASAVVDVGAATAVDVQLLHGFAMLVRLRAFEEVGGLDARRFPSGYGSEADLSLRLRDRGWSLRVAPGSVVWHAGSGSTSPGRRWVGVVRGRLALERVHGGSRLRSARRETERALDLPMVRQLFARAAIVPHGGSAPESGRDPRERTDVLAVEDSAV